MKRLIIFLTIIAGFYNINLAQETFNWTDSIFKVGQTRNIHLSTACDGPCTVYPCYDLGDNKQTYDTLISFLKSNEGISIVFIWHTTTIGSSQYNFQTSKIFAEGLIEELIRLGVNKQQIAAIGFGESRPLVKEEELKEIEDRNLRFLMDWINKRIEVIITSTP